MLTDKWIVAGVDILRTLFTLYIFSVFLAFFLLRKKEEFKQLQAS